MNLQTLVESKNAESKNVESKNVESKNVEAKMSKAKVSTECSTSVKIFNSSNTLSPSPSLCMFKLWDFRPHHHPQDL